MAKPTGRPVRDEVLEAARLAIQRVGVRSVTFGDLAAEIGIKAPSIHHHFQRKEDLVAEVVACYRESFNQWVATIDDPSPLDRIRHYGSRFSATADDDLMCLCGAAAAEWSAVGEEPRAEVAGFFQDQVAWLTEQLEAARTAGEVAASTEPGPVAAALLAVLEGSVLISRAGSPTEAATASTDLVLDLLAPAEERQAAHR